MSQVAINETQSPLIGKLVSFWDYDQDGAMTKLYGTVDSSFDDEDSRCEVLHISLKPMSAAVYGFSYSDQNAHDVKEV